MCVCVHVNKIHACVHVCLCIYTHIDHLSLIFFIQTVLYLYLGIAELCTFYLLYKVWWYGSYMAIPQFMSSPLLMDIWNVPSFQLLPIVLLWTYLYVSGGAPVHSFLLSIYLEVAPWDINVLILNFDRKCQVICVFCFVKCLFQLLVHFSIWLSFSY